MVRRTGRVRFKLEPGSYFRNQETRARLFTCRALPTTSNDSSSSMRKFYYWLAISALHFFNCSGISAAQDTRTVSEPKLPPICTTLPPQLRADNGHPTEAAENQLDSARIQEAIDHCPAGYAVSLAPDRGNDIFLSGPLELRPGVTLLVQEHVVLFASSNPRLYDVRPGGCGVVNDDGRGCKPLVHADHAVHGAVMGLGAIDGQGGEHLLHQDVTWWDL